MKVEVSLEVVKDSDIWVERKLDLPFAPYEGLTLVFAESVADSNVLTSFRVEYVDWIVPKQKFICYVDYMMGGPEDNPHQIEVELVGLGWSSTRDKSRN